MTEAASALTQTSATLNATVNPNGVEVSACKFEYGTSTSYGKTAPCAALPGSGTSAVAVSAPVSGLTLNTTYHFRISATNASGTGEGSDQTFTTLANPPTVVTEAASGIGATAASLNAIVNPHGGTLGDCHFEYGLSASYGQSVPCASLPAGSGVVAVAAPVSGLAANTTYHFRISAMNSGGVSEGSDQTFTDAQGAGNSTGQATCVVTGACHWYQGITVVRASSPPLPIAAGKPVPVLSWGTLTLESAAGSETCRTAALGIDENPAGGGAGIGETRAFATANCEAVGCPPVNALEVVVSPERLPWGSVLQEAGSRGSGASLRPIVRSKTRLAPAGAGAAAELSQVGEQLSSRCAFRPGGPPGSPAGEGWASKYLQANGATKAQGEAFEKGELERQEVGSYPAAEPGRQPVIALPGAPISTCHGETQPKLILGAGPGQRAGKLEFDQPATGKLECGAFGKGTIEGELRTMGYGGAELINAF